MAVATHNDHLAIVDVDEMRVVRFVSADVGAPLRSSIAQLAAGRHDDTWVALAGFGLWGVDGVTGQLVALRDPNIVKPCWLDLHTETAAATWWIAHDAGSVFALEPVELVSGTELARALETAAAK